MRRYREMKDGVELVGEGHSTFIREDTTSRSWREYLAWRAAGHSPEPPLPRPFVSTSDSRKRLLIAGAGGFGREVFSMAATARGAGVEWVVSGFLSDVPGVLDDFPGLPPIVGGTDHLAQPDEVFFCAIGEIAGRKAVCQRLLSQGAYFANLIQPHALIASNAQLGTGLIIEAFTGIGAHARIGDFCSILGHTSIAHDVTLGPFVQVSPFACLLGRVEVGEETLIGTHAVILPGVKIGARATIGAGAVVLKNVPEGETVFGVPAVRLK